MYENCHCVAIDFKENVKSKSVMDSVVGTFVICQRQNWLVLHLSLSLFGDGAGDMVHSGITMKGDFCTSASFDYYKSFFAFSRTVFCIASFHRKECTRIENISVYNWTACSTMANMTKYLPPANEVCEGYVFTGICLPTDGRSLSDRPPDRDPP